MNNARLKILLVVVMLISSLTTWAQTDTAHIYFNLDIPTLDAQAVKKIDSLIYFDIINQEQELLIVGYADHLGTDDYNDKLSEKRANNVKAYLESMGIPADHVKMCVGRGEVPRDLELPDGYAADRRVDIVGIQTKKKFEQPVVAEKKEKKEQSVTPRKKEEPLYVQSSEAIQLNSSVDFEPDDLHVGQLFVLDRIFFYTGRHIVTKESLPEIESLYKMLNEHLRMEIRIEGHVCCVHPLVDALDMDTGEEKLSVNRAKYIYEYLVRKGIDAGRLSYQGFGKKYPLSPTEYTQEEQDMNKRVEIRIMKL